MTSQVEAVGIIEAGQSPARCGEQMMDHVMTEKERAAITTASEQIAKELLSIDIWRTHWRVEVDGCVFKLKVDGYPKRGTERWKRRQKELEDANREFAAEFATDQ